MKHRVAWPVLGLLVFLIGPAICQTRDVKEVAELLPAQTLFSVEVRHPDKFAKEVEALVKGSALDDLPATMARFRAKQKDPFNYFGSDVSGLGLLLSPEVLRDMGKVRGAAVAITGFTKDGPEYVAVVLTGDSTIARVFMRGSLSFNRMFIVGEAGGVPIYREKARLWKKEAFRKDGPPTPPAPPVIEERGPAMAMTPAMIVLGSRKELVADVLLRSRGKASDPPLASLSAYKDAAKVRDKAGLFFYADPAALDAQLERMAKGKGPGLPHDVNLARVALPLKATRSVTAMLSLQGGNLHLQAHLNLVPGAKHGLLEALPSSKVATELLAFAPRGSTLTGVRGWDRSEARFGAIVKLLDDLARASNPKLEALPSKAIEGLEAKLEMSIGKDVLGRITSAGIVANFAEGKARHTPLLLVKARDAEAATFLLDRAVPKLMAAFGAKKGAGKPSIDKVLGQSITTIPGEPLPGWDGANIGKKGTVLVIGPDKLGVATALVTAQKGTGMLTDLRVSSVLKGHDDPVALAIVSLAQPLTALFKQEITPVAPRYKKYRPDFKDAPPVKRPKPAPPKTPEFVTKGVQDMSKALSGLAPLIVSMERKPNTIIVEARQSGLRGVASRAISVWVEGDLQRSAHRIEPIWDEFPPPPSIPKDREKAKE